MSAEKGTYYAIIPNISRNSVD